ncbi:MULTISPECIES: AAA family ATPase [Rhodococcus erythropolis group]|uniref:AAA family ATPase n=1 Tax=Rhodococcus baikonurensis TaxID=172041 RepID=A0ABV5XP92_9NOCA|nr:AAA family ATPase [Rhodococcus qingshengii]KSU67450.1 hypothetical protein AS032_31620 [Rhodococcus qingshengii]SCC69433.1 AAA domain (dynein-related subfamily) [Rhodococcus qingshengii]
MIVYGISYTTDRFAHEVKEAHVAFATDAGVYVSGHVDDLVIERTEPTVEALTALGFRVQEAAEKAAADAERNVPGGVPYQPMITSMPGDSDAIPDDNTQAWHAIALRLADRYAGMGGQYGSVEEFVEKAQWARREVEQSSEGPTTPTFVDGYIPRSVDGVHTDIEILRQARTYGMHVIQSGPPGTGKSTSATAAHGDHLLTIACYDGMTFQDLVGQYLPVPGEAGVFRYVDGALVTAMLTGRPLLLDDFGWMPSGVQATLLPVLDHRRTLTVLDRPDEQVITAAEGFCVIINLNPGIGFGVTSPIRDRSAFELHVPVDLKAASKLGIPAGFIEVAQHLHTLADGEAANGIRRWVPSMRSLIKARDLTMVFDEHFAACAMLGECPDGEQRMKLQSLLTTELGLGIDVPEPLQARSL